MAFRLGEKSFGAVAQVVAVVSLWSFAARAQTPTAVNRDPVISVQPLAIDRGAAALWQSLQKLHTRASLLMVTAHPDDEVARRGSARHVAHP